MGFRSLTAIALAARGGPFRVDWPLDAAEVVCVIVATGVSEEDVNCDEVT